MKKDAAAVGVDWLAIGVRPDFAGADLGEGLGFFGQGNRHTETQQAKTEKNDATGQDFFHEERMNCVGLRSESKFALRGIGQGGLANIRPFSRIMGSPPWFLWLPTKIELTIG